MANKKAITTTPTTQTAPQKVQLKWSPTPEDLTPPFIDVQVEMFSRDGESVCFDSRANHYHVTTRPDLCPGDFELPKGWIIESVIVRKEDDGTVKVFIDCDRSDE